MTDHITSIDSYKGVTIVRFAGSITFANLASAQAEWRAKTKGRAIKNILFDLKEVSATDTSGLAALIDLLKHMKSRQAGDKIGLINLSREIKDLLEISKIAPLFTEYSSEEEAITDLT